MAATTATTIYGCHYGPLLPGPGKQAAGRFLILSYFYGFLILRSEQVAGTPTVRRVGRWRMAYGFIYMCIHVYMYLCVHAYAHV